MLRSGTLAHMTNLVEPKGGADAVTRQTSTLQRRRLLLALKDLRERANYTQKEVAAHLEWSPSKLLRIENGQVGISRTDLQALLDHYGVKEKRQRDQLLAMAREANKPSPYNAYRDALSPEFMTYLDYESSALRVRIFEPLLIPGLLQIRAYAESVVRAYAADTDSEVLMQQRVEARIRRQDLLEGSDSPEFYFIVDEAALHRMVGIEADGAGPETMIDQLEHLKVINKRDNVHIRVVPFAAGAHRGLTGPFFHLEFPPEVHLPDIAYLENARGDAVIVESGQDEATTSPYLATFFGLEDIATNESALDEALDLIIAEQRRKVAEMATAGSEELAKVLLHPICAAPVTPPTE